MYAQHPEKQTNTYLIYICSSVGILCNDRARASQSKLLISVSSSPLVGVVTRNTDGGENKHNTYLPSAIRPPAEKVIRLTLLYEIPACVCWLLCV